MKKKLFWPALAAIVLSAVVGRVYFRGDPCAKSPVFYLYGTVYDCR